MRVRGHNPFQSIEPNLPDEILWQDWIYEDEVLAHDINELFKRDPPSDDGNENGGADDENGGGGDGGPGNDNNGSGNNDSNKCDMPRRSGRACNTRQQGTMAGTSSGTRKVELSAGVIADILAATHAMPSWKACQMENTSWSGTADENIQRYVSSIGIEEPNAGERTGTSLMRLAG